LGFFMQNLKQRVYAYSNAENKNLVSQRLLLKKP